MTRRVATTSGLLPRVEPLEARAYLSAAVALGAAIDFPGVTSPSGIAEADFNADGGADIAVVGVNPSTNLPSVGVYLNGAPAVFYDLAGAKSAQDIATHDLNNDGATDIIVTDPVSGTVNVLLSNGDGTFQAPIAISYGTAQPIGTAATAYIVVDDFNDDGNADMAVTDPADHQISILLGAVYGTFTLGTPITSADAAFDPTHILIADFNSDGVADLAYADGTTAQVSVVLGNDDGTFGAPATIAIGGAAQGLAAGDVNGDGQTDLVASVATGGGTGAVDMSLNSGGVFAAAVPLATSFSNPGPVAVADINGDQIPDIVTLNSTGALDLFIGNGAGTFGSPIESQATTTGTPVTVLTTDVNGDNKADTLFTEINPTITGGGGFGLVAGASAPEVSPGIAGKLPASLIAGQKTPIIQTVSLTNVTGSMTVQGSVSVVVALSTDATYSSDDTVIDPITVTGKIKIGQTKTKHVRITDVPADLAAGNYFVVVQATDPAGASLSASSVGTINIIAPLIDLSGNFKKAPTAATAGKHLSATITVTNTGNVSATGTLPIVIDTSIIDTLDDTAIQAVSFDKKVSIKPGKSVTIQLSKLIAPGTANSYYLIVQLDPSNTLGDVKPANNTFATGAAIVVS